MKRIGLAAILLVVVWFLPSSAQAQCNGVFGANTVCGSAAGGPPSPVALGTIGGVTGPGSSTPGCAAPWANTSGTLLGNVARCIFNVRAPPFNAKGDGVTDDTTAIQSAISAATSGAGGAVYFPAGNYLVSGAGSCLFNINNNFPFYMFGDGLSVSNVEVSGAVGASTDVFCVTPTTGTAGYNIHDLAILPSSGTPARYGIHINTTSNSNAEVYAFAISNIQIGVLGSTSIFGDNGTGTNAAGGFFYATIAQSLLQSINIAYGGDGISITSNTISGASGIGIHISQVAGTAGVVIANNVISNPGGCIVVDSGIGPVVQNNECENTVASGDANNAQIDITGSVASVVNPKIIGNNITSTSSGTAIPIRIAAAASSYIDSNRIYTPQPPVTLTTNNSTSSGTTLHLASTTGVFTGMLVQDNTSTSAITLGTTIISCVLNTSCTTSAAVAGTVGSSDSLTFSFPHIFNTASASNTVIGAGNYFSSGPSPTIGLTITDGTTSTIYLPFSTVQTGTSGGVPYYNAGGRLASSALLSTNAVVVGAGAGAGPFTSNVGTNGQALIAKTGVPPVFASAIGDVSIGTPNGSNQANFTVSSIGGNAVSLGGAFTMSGAFNFTGTLTNTTSVTFPTSGTLATTANPTFATNVAVTPANATTGSGVTINAPASANSNTYWALGIQNAAKTDNFIIGVTSTYSGAIGWFPATGSIFYYPSSGSLYFGTGTGSTPTLTLTTSQGILVGASGSSSAPSLAVGAANSGMYTVSTTGLGLTVGGVLELDYGITTGSIWTAAVGFTSAGVIRANSGFSANGTAGLASKSCLINTANAVTGVTLTITGGLITGTTTC